MRNALLHLVHPDTFEDIVSGRHKKMIVERLLSAQERLPDIDRSLLVARGKLQAGERFYSSSVRARWDPDAAVAQPPIDGKPAVPTVKDGFDTELLVSQEFLNEVRELILFRRQLVFY